MSEPWSTIRTVTAPSSPGCTVTPTWVERVCTTALVNASDSSSAASSRRGWPASTMRSHRRASPTAVSAAANTRFTGRRVHVPPSAAASSGRRTRWRMSSCTASASASEGASALAMPGTAPASRSSGVGGSRLVAHQPPRPCRTCRIRHAG